MNLVEPMHTVFEERGQHFDVRHSVPLVPQFHGMSCWAAAAAMLIGWRDRVPVEGPEVARGAGRWAAFSRGLRPRDVDHLARVWGLVPVRQTEHTVASLRALLESRGPLWMGEAVPALHVVVVVGMHGDGTPEGTTVRINDPWPVGRGERYSVSFLELLRNYRAAAQIAGFHCQLLHAGGRGGVSSRSERRWKTSIRVSHPAIPRPIIERKPMLHPNLAPAPAIARAPAPLSQAAGWAADAQSPDYRHIGQPGMSQRFEVSHDVLDRLAGLNGFDLSGQRLVLFGLRGCELIGSASAFSRSFAVTETIPDHSTRRCVMGVWDRTARQVSGFEGSTVPTLRSLRRQAASPTSLSIANLLPTGLYSYTVGTHGGSVTVPGAFRQRGPVVVIRSLNDTTITVSDRFLVHVPADNIHPTLSGGTGFSSAGCNTVSGTYSGGHRGDWAVFRERAGLTPTQTSHTHPFSYMLLTGREARVGATMGTALTRLRFGSSGTSVQALQDGLVRSGHLERRGGAFHLPTSANADITVSRSRLRGDASGSMRSNTTLAYIHWQQANDSGRADGIVTPVTARRLGFDPIRRMSVNPSDSPQPQRAPVPAPAPAPAANRDVFPDAAVTAARNLFQRNAGLARAQRRNCILIIRDVAPQLWGANAATAARVTAALNALRGRDIKMTRFGDEIRRLGLESHRDEIRFANGNGNARPGAMVTSAWDTIMNRVGTTQGWHVFGLAVFNGWHSVTVFVNRTAQGATLYWADQWAIDPGDDFHQEAGSVSGWRTYTRAGFDRFITERTQAWWDEVNARRGNPRWLASTWIYKFRSQ